MKMKGNDCGAINTRVMSLKGLRVLIMGRNSMFIRRLREHLLYSRLRCSVPPLQALQEHLFSKPHCWAAPNYNKRQDEVPVCDSNQDNSSAMLLDISQEDFPNSKGEGERGYYIDGDDEDDNVNESSEPFVPSIKIKRKDKILLISAVVCKDVAISLVLFRVLKEEKLDIVHENQYRTETKVSHTIQARLHPDLDLVALKEKLLAWAGKT